MTTPRQPVDVPQGWMTIQQDDERYSSSHQTNPLGFIDPNYDPDHILPPPRSVRMTVSGRRDASTVEVSYDGIIPREWLQKQLRLMYGQGFLWYVGADDCTYRIREGVPTTDVVFRFGPYRQAPRTLFNASYYLYEELTRIFPTLLDFLSTRWNTQAAPTPMNPAGPLATDFIRDRSSETAFWRYILGLRLVNGRMNIHLAGLPEMRDEIARQIYRDCFMGYLQYDDVVRQLYEKWMFIVWMNPDYLTDMALPRDITQSTVLTDPETGEVFTEYQVDLRNGAALLFTNPEVIPPPRFRIQNVLDLVPVVYSTPGALDAIPVVDDIEFEVPQQLHLRQFEDTALQFYYAGQPLIGGGSRAPFGGGLVTTELRNLISGSNYWRFSNSWFTYLVGTEVDIPQVNALNPWTLWSAALMPDIWHANLQCHLMQQVNFMPNRKRKVTAPAPLTADEVRQLLPGSAVKLRRSDEYYWITELRISTPPLIMELDLVYPGRSPDDATLTVALAGGDAMMMIEDGQVDDQTGEAPTIRGEYDADLPVPAGEPPP